MRDETMADEMEARLIEFGVRILNVATALPKSIAAEASCRSIASLRNGWGTQLRGSARLGKPRRFRSQVKNRSQGAQ